MGLELSDSTRQLQSRVFWRYRLFSWVVAQVVFMSVIFFGLRWIERAITFHPVPYTPGKAWTPPHNAEDVWFNTKDGVRLHGWYFSSSESDAPTIIYFHGNGGNISDIGWLGERLYSRAYNVLLFDYRGYGRSEGSVTDEVALYADGDAAYDYAVESKFATPKSMVLYGQSLGTTAAVELASRRECGAVILESGLSSASDMARNVFPWLPRFFHRIGRNRFDSVQKMAQIKCPVLITHGQPDPVIPTEHSQALYEAAREPKELLIFPGVGHNVFGALGTDYLERLDSFIQKSLKLPDQ